MQENIPLKLRSVHEALDILRGAMMIVYPMNLPPHDVIREELSNTEDLSGTQVNSCLTILAKIYFAKIYFLPRFNLGKDLLSTYKLRFLDRIEFMMSLCLLGPTLLVNLSGHRARCFAVKLLCIIPSFLALLNTQFSDIVPYLYYF